LRDVLRLDGENRRAKAVPTLLRGEMHLYALTVARAKE